ncbi:MerR family transcriptional regulator [Actinoplanes subtropicus]|uniref:MerR family transcriptional regulator n=1 Tax=Actinoplanes subtropicus TaxID=543632 RepID=UPI000A039DEA|nr:MerR family transcriptional regulator [Actinoplanes subtropicus]
MAASSRFSNKTAIAGGGAARDPQRETQGLYPISVVTELTGLGAYTLRGYERAGLLQPARTAGGMRLYSPRDVTLVRRAATLAAEGANLTAIRRILALEAQVSALRAKLKDSCARGEQVPRGRSLCAMGP